MRFLLVLLTLLAGCLPLPAQTHQWLFQRRAGAGGPWSPVTIAGQADRFFGLDASGNLTLAAVSTATALDELTDVSLSTPSAGQLLRFSAGGWGNWTHDFLTSSAAASAYQPLDSDLTSIAALTTTAHGRGLLTQADAASARLALGVEQQEEGVAQVVTADVNAAFGGGFALVHTPGGALLIGAVDESVGGSPPSVERLRDILSSYSAANPEHDSEWLAADLRTRLDADPDLIVTREGTTLTIICATPGAAAAPEALLGSIFPVLELTTPGVTGWRGYSSAIDGSRISGVNAATLGGMTTAQILAAGPVIRRRAVMHTTAGSGATAIPLDNTVPQWTEGTLYATVPLAGCTPGNVIDVDVSGYVSRSAAGTVTLALFQNGTCFGASAVSIASGYSVPFCVRGSVSVTDPTMTISLRYGASTATTTFINRLPSGALFGDVSTVGFTLTETPPP